MSLKSDLVALLYEHKLNLLASSLIIANGTVEEYLETDMKILIALMGMFIFCCISLVISVGWYLNRRVTLSLLLVAVYCLSSFPISLDFLRVGSRFHFPDDQPSLALLKGDSIHLKELISNIYNSGYTLKRLSYDLYENGQLFNYTTRLYVGGNHNFDVGNALFGARFVNVGSLNSIYGEVFEVT